MQVAEAQVRLEHNRRYVAFLQHQIDIKEARVVRQKAQELEVMSSRNAALCLYNGIAHPGGFKRSGSLHSGGLYMELKVQCNRSLPLSAYV